ncbi:MAG: hypothetical protein PHO32_01630 [Candidatus Cloacimonetes bacterium]|nr:hypothetical protein [Candidatus Cloacimonadota bacterium]
MKKTQGSDFPTTASIVILVDGTPVIDFNESSINTWEQKQCNITSGTHTISIYNDELPGARVDELEIYSY